MKGLGVKLCPRTQEKLDRVNNRWAEIIHISVCNFKMCHSPQTQIHKLDL